LLKNFCKVTTIVPCKIYSYTNWEISWEIKICKRGEEMSIYKTDTTIVYVGN